MKTKLSVIIGFALILGLTIFAAQSLPPTAVSAQQEFRIIGYQTSWSGSINQVQFDKLTHVNYAFLLPNDNGDGSLQPLDNPPKLRDLVAAAHANNVKVLISVGGWNDGNDQGFETLAANPTSRAAFVNNMVDFVNTYNLDGVDIDWEYPDPGTSGDNYSALMQALSTAMHSRGKLLTAAVVAQGYTGGGVQDEVFGYVDYLMIMAYDGGNGADHSPYSYAVDSLNYWRGRGLSQSKAVLGLPFYGRPTWASYKNLVANDPDAPNKDVTIYNGTTTYYNGMSTIRAKTEYAIQQGSGVMTWELSQDTADHTSLLKVMYDTANGGTLPTSTPPTVTAPPPTPTTPPGGCTATPWAAGTTYYNGDLVSHNGREWRAKWWTLNEEPGTTGQWGVWEDRGPCQTNPQPTATPPATVIPSPTGNPTQPPPTAVPTMTATPDPGGNEWVPNHFYNVGESVTYNGAAYTCLQAHTSLTGWEPPNVPALWSPN